MTHHAMRLPITVALAAAGAMAGPATECASAQGPSAAVPVLVSADWLTQNLRNPRVVVIHSAQQRADYDAGHVPGSRWLPWNAYTTSVPSGLSTQLPPLAQLDSSLEAIGVTDATHIVISGGPIQTSGRLFFTLEHAGLGGRVSLLDGGIDAWRESGRPVETDEPAPAVRGSLTLTATPARVADAEWVSANAGKPGISVLDARTPEFYSGTSAGGQPRAGHIPGAGNVPFSWLTGELGTMRERAKLQRLFDQAGVARGNKVVTYCHIGMQASALYVAARVLGYDAAVYDGSWEDWSRRAELPVAGGRRP